MHRSYSFTGLGLLLLFILLLLGRWSQRSSSGQKSAVGPQLLRQIGSIDVPGPKGKRFDYLTIDPE